MASLSFTKRDLIYVPWVDDKDLDREAAAIIRSCGNASWKNGLKSQADFQRINKGSAWWRRLWVLSHGGNGSLRIYNTSGSESLTAEELARDLVEKGFDSEAVPEILIWACFSGRLGGFAQALWTYLGSWNEVTKKAGKRFPKVRVTGFRGITGTVLDTGELLDRGTAIYRPARRLPPLRKNRAHEDGDYRVMDEEMLTTYPHECVYSYEHT